MSTRPSPAELTAKQWSDATARWLVEAWKARGGRLSEFAREHGVSADRVRWWVMRLAAEERKGERPRVRKKQAAPTTFIPGITTMAAPAASSAERVIVRLPGGVEVDATSTTLLPPEWRAMVARIVAGGA